MKTIKVIGNHAILPEIVRQYVGLGYEVDCCSGFEDDEVKEVYDEYFIAFEDSATDGTDAVLIARLEVFSEGILLTEKGKPLCHLLIHDNSLLHLMRTVPLYSVINRKVELHVFTLEDQWAKVLLCLSESPLRYPRLDRLPVTLDSFATVHLVIDGWGDMGEALAVHTALVCHFPNYIRDHRLRTRITIIDTDMIHKRDSFLFRYRHLMDNSYYRFVEVSRTAEQTYFHAPMYEATREDFVDVEWEFVQGDISSRVICDKIELWKTDNRQQLSIALCDADETKNLQKAIALAELTADAGTTIFVKTRDGRLMDEMRKSGDAFYAHLYPFGMTNVGYDVTLPLVKMAKLLHYYYYYSFTNQQPPTCMPHEEVELLWHEIELLPLRYSNVANVMCIPYKLRSVGHEKEGEACFYALSQREIETLAEVEHNRWNVERLLLGFRPPTLAEQQDIRSSIEHYCQTGEGEDLKKHYKFSRVHYDICAFRELGIDKTGKEVRQYDYDLTACIPLIAEEARKN